jgi:hypothetical protein
MIRTPTPNTAKGPAAGGGGPATNRMVARNAKTPPTPSLATKATDENLINMHRTRNKSKELAKELGGAETSSMSNIMESDHLEVHLEDSLGLSISSSSAESSPVKKTPVKTPKKQRKRPFMSMNGTKGASAEKVLHGGSGARKK